MLNPILKKSPDLGMNRTSLTLNEETKDEYRRTKHGMQHKTMSLLFSSDRKKTYLGMTPVNIKADWERLDLDRTLQRAQGLATVKNGMDNLHQISDTLQDKMNRVFLKNHLPKKPTPVYS